MQFFPIMHLLHHRGALGAAVRELGSSPSTPSPARAVVLAGLGADGLAVRDLDALHEHEPLVHERPLPGGPPAAMVCSAVEWHMARRVAMLSRHPELNTLYSSFGNNRKWDLAVTCSLIVGMVALDWMAMAACTAAGLMRPSTVVLLACTVGATTAYGKQALTHELGHIDPRHPLAVVCSRLASAHTLFPWAMYYWNYHARHHAHTGGVMDRDGEILFHQWHLPPPMFRPSPFRRWLWTGVFAMTVYVQFCMAKAKLDSPHRPALQHEGLIALVMVVFTYCWGWLGLAYLVLSSGFSLGAFGHPFIHFWMVQHLFVRNRDVVMHTRQDLATLALVSGVRLSQPTMSFQSFPASPQAWIWHALHFGELRHVEHHDFPLIPYLRAHRIPQIAPEFYENLVQSTSPFHTLHQWLVTPNLLAWMRVEGDFAGRETYLRQVQAFVGGDSEEEEDGDGEGASATAPAVGEDVDDEVAFVERSLRRHPPPSR